MRFEPGQVCGTGTAFGSRRAALVEALRFITVAARRAGDRLQLELRCSGGAGLARVNVHHAAKPGAGFGSFTDSALGVTLAPGATLQLELRAGAPGAPSFVVFQVADVFVEQPLAVTG